MIVEIVAKILRVLRVPEYRNALLRAGVFASTEHDTIIGGLRLDTIVDIGANRGQFALCVRRHYPRAEIFSFEPLQKPAGKYLEVFRGDPHAHLINKAVAAQSSSAVMHVSRWDVSSSLLPIAQAQHDNFPFTEESRRETVSLAPLSDCLDTRSIKGMALLKLDVQGYELSALHGCEDLLDRFSYVYVEASFIELYVGQALASDVIGYLLARGFNLTCVANLTNGKAGRPIQADFLFSRTPLIVHADRAADLG
jgi:FkbM family methyltransferase